MTAFDLIRQLWEWDGEAFDWQLRAACDYNSDLDDVILRAILLGAVEVRVALDPDEDLIRLTERGRR